MYAKSCLTRQGYQKLFTSKMMSLLSLLSSALLVSTQSFAEDLNHREDTKLLLVQAVLRHGERAPLFLYKNDPNEPDIWAAGLSKLSRNGKKHHYALGKFLRSMYDGFLTTDPKEVCANSSSEDRCLRGAEVTVAALYEPEGIWKFEDDLKWQPIPVFYLSENEDKILNNVSPCPRGSEELKRLRYSDDMLELARKHQKMLEDVSSYVEMNISLEFNALVLYDTLFVEKMNHLAIPTLLDNYFEELQEFEEATFKCMFGSDLLLRLRYGSLLGEIIGNMKKKMNGEISDLKFQLSCVKDVHVAALLKALSFEGMPRPPYCATLLFELHEMADATLAVRLLYVNSTNPMTDTWAPHIMVLDDCSEFCPLENFTKRFQYLIPEDWDQECHLNTAESGCSKSVGILILVFIIIAAVCFISLFGIYYYSKRKNKIRDEKCLSRVTASIAGNVT